MHTTSIILLTVLFGCATAIFDCRRDSSLCKNGGTCNSNSRTCACVSPTYEGYDCSVPTADKTHADCTSSNPCLNGGTCHKPAGSSATPSCLCTEDYTGATCNTKRYQATCNTTDDYMSVTMIPFIDTFSGNILVEGQPKTATTCMLSGNPLTVTISNTDATCGSTTDTIVDGNTHKSRVFIMRFIVDTLTSRDEKITIVCGTGNTVEKSSGAITIAAIDANLHAVTESQVPLTTDVDLVLQVGGTTVSGSVNLGDDITVKADLTTAGLKKYQAVRFKSCVGASHSSNTATGYKELKLVDAYCLHADTKTVQIGKMSKSGTAVMFTIDAYKYQSSTTLFINCIVEVCQTSASCAPATCGSETTPSGYGRKKREAGVINEILERSVTIRDPLEAVAKTLQEFKETKACYQSWEMIATVVALAVALLIVILICIILIVKTILNRRRRSAEREDVSETNSIAHFPHLPTIVSNKT